MDHPSHQSARTFQLRSGALGDWRALVCSGAVAALIAWRWAAVLSTPFVYEDAHWADATWTFNWMLRGGPLTIWSWHLVNQPLASHLLNVTLHLIVSTLVVLLARELFWPESAALAAGALMLFAPITTEAVLYASARGHLISAMFVLLTCVLLLRGALWHLAWCSALAAYLSKETALALIPLFFLIFDLKGMALALSVGLALVISSQMRLTPGDDPWVLTLAGKASWAFWQIVATGRLIGQAIWPNALTVDYFYGGVSGLQAVAWASMLPALGVVAYRFRLPALAFCACWLVSTLAMRYALVTPRSLLNEHQFYLPFVGMALAGGRLFA